MITRNITGFGDTDIETSYSGDNSGEDFLIEKTDAGKPIGLVASLKEKVSKEFYKEFLADFEDSYDDYQDVIAINTAYVQDIAALVDAGVGEDVIRMLPAHSGREYLLCKDFADASSFAEVFMEHGNLTHIYLKYDVTKYLELLIKNNKEAWLPKCAQFPGLLQEALGNMDTDSAIGWTEVILGSNSCFANFSFLTDFSSGSALNSFDLLLSNKIRTGLGVDYPRVSFRRLTLDYSKVLWVRLQVDNHLYKLPLYQILKDSFSFDGFRDDHCPRYVVACYGRGDTVSVVLNKVPASVAYSNIDFTAGQCFNPDDINPVETVLASVFGAEVIEKKSAWKLPFVYSAMFEDPSWRLLVDKPSLLALVPWYLTGDTINITMTRFLNRKISNDFPVGDYNSLQCKTGEAIDLRDLFNEEERADILKRLSEVDINDCEFKKV